MRSLLEIADFTERKISLRSFIKRIVVNKKQVTIYYNLPMPPDDKKQSIGVLPIVTPGGAGETRTPDFLLVFTALCPPEGS